MWRWGFLIPMVQDFTVAEQLVINISDGFDLSRLSLVVINIATVIITKLFVGSALDRFVAGFTKHFIHSRYGLERTQIT